MLEQWQKALIEAHGWFYTADFQSPHMPNQVDIHTHGIFENYDHWDLQVCLPVTADELEYISELFRLIVAEIQAGRRFEEGVAYSGLLGDPYPLRFVMASLQGKKYLRLLYPDRDGTLESFPYNTQVMARSDFLPLIPVYFEPEDLDSIDDVAQFVISLNTAYGIHFTSGFSFEQWRAIPGNQGHFTAGGATRLQAVLQRCVAICGQQYDMDKIASHMAQVRQSMSRDAWLREPRDGKEAENP